MKPAGRLRGRDNITEWVDRAHQAARKGPARRRLGRPARQIRVRWHSYKPACERGGTSDEGESSNFTIHGQNRPGGNIMKRALTALALAGTLAIATIATPTSAHAQWRRGWGWGLGGLALGLFIGAALSRPAYGYGGGYYRPAYRSAYYGGYRPAYRPAVYGGYRVARGVAIHRARWR